MNKIKIILAVVFFLLIFVLADFLFLELFNNKIVAYLTLGVGFSLWYYSFKHQNSAGIFSGSLIFFTGIIIFVISSFVIWNPSRMVFPALLLSVGLASFFTYLNDKKFFYLIITIALSLLGFSFLYARMNFKLSVFFNAFPDLLLGIGIFILLLTIILYYLFRRKNFDQKNEVNDSLNENDDYKI